MAANETPPAPKLTVSRFLPVLGVFSVAVALVGFLIGIAGTPPVKGATDFVGRARKVGSAVPAPTYREMAEGSLSPNAEWSGRLGDLTGNSPNLFDPVSRTAAMKHAAIADRARNRAFDGAPPVIPHPVEQQSAANCLACHGKGLKIGSRIATRMSHEAFSSCTQCHVETDRSDAFDLPPSATPANDFKGLYRSGPGIRAQVGSPPTIPHHTWLREDCLSCHGVIARPGLRTTHPWLSNCVQCHAADTRLNQSSIAK